MQLRKRSAAKLGLALPLSLFFLALALGAQDAPDFSGFWKQDLARTRPPTQAKRPREFRIQQSGRTLHIRVINRSGPTLRNLDLNYEIDGPEITYAGLDGNQFRSKVRLERGSLVFDTAERQHGRELLSRQVWTLSENHRILREMREVKEDGAIRKSEAFFNKEEPR